MSEDTSSDEDWCVSTISRAYDAPPRAKCWECGKKIRNLASLMSHYKSHNIKATCHICKVTFCRLTSLSTHLDNAHSPPLCKKCHQSFSNMWELNKHAETHCIGPASFQGGSSLIPAVTCKGQQSGNSVLHDSVSELRPEQRADMKRDERPETFENSVEYIVGEDDKDIDSDCEKADDSTTSESDEEDKTRSKPTDLRPNDAESDGGSDSSSTDCSSQSSNKPEPKTTRVSRPGGNGSLCAVCGRGPFRSVKLHLLHCSGVRVKYKCFRCKKIFQTVASLKEHHMPLYSCDVCGQVFSPETSSYSHQCPKGSKSSLVLFCSESMPKACNICKSFFTSEKTLLTHVTRVHMSVVSTKVCIITNPSVLTNNKVTPDVNSIAVQSATSRPNVVNRAINGKLHVGQPYAASMSTVVKSIPSSSHPPTPPVPVGMVSAAAPVISGKVGALDQPVNQASSHLSAPHGATESSPGAAASDTGPPPAPTILAMFENDSQDAALMKRMNTNWRSKATYPCRQCGAILRQPSLIISHRYLHRGHRSHQCQCGRAFKHRLHLLRHCVQHAEALSYICVSCGDTFTGAKLLAEHLKGKSQKKSCSGRTRKRKVKRKCRMPFTCDCGQLFFRPSAFIWHQLKNRTKS